MGTILKAENISKQYRLGTVGSGTLGDDLKRWWYAVRGKEDPFLKIGSENDRRIKADSDYVWALRDINFEVEQGEVLGIIGKNGAGKSTLLKLLSRVTSPTTGSIKTKGRIASLLEVGTGFHGELTGRENIFMNGAVLGMTKTEIKSKLDEIIAFSGCEKYIDTPVKRYSSGMTVRLGFAVAAHLEPEILVVDEVLAVGDAEFQKKAIGKMQDLSRGEGSTVLFVSHNMASVKSLCTDTIILENGVVTYRGKPETAIDHYLDNQINYSESLYKNNSPKFTDILELKTVGSKNQIKNVFKVDDQIKVNLIFRVDSKYLSQNPIIGIRITNKNSITVFTTQIELKSLPTKIGENTVELKFPKKLLVPNHYTISLGFHIPNKEIISKKDSISSFTVEETGSEFHIYRNNNYGCVFVDCKWSLIE
ncbi:ABC transporter ATP-binding protein [Christiangramia echinicola]|uniref:ABC transporter ATP-binding protein n=1 Tax=Christiangramia echinicola TaxID=279359 RepID=UPI0003F99844|nr:ABC transporter ATP-binding protein [Christiangramia echinicola]